MCKLCNDITDGGDDLKVSSLASKPSPGVKCESTVSRGFSPVL